MKPLAGSDIIKASGGKLRQGDPATWITGFVIDSRQAGRGDFFVPLQGEHEDGHRYVLPALEAGAAGAFYARRPLPAFPPRALVIEVEEPLRALQRVAAFHRRRFTLPVVGVTGSSGKTTTKDLIAAVLAASLPVLKTEGNLNNEIGLPLSLLELDDDHRAAVLEMGMSAPGEIALLAEIAAPTIGVLTNIGEAHLEFFGSLEAIARAKEELLEYLGEEGTAVLNGDDPYLREMGKRFPGKVYYYGFADADFQAVDLSHRKEGSTFRVRFPAGQVYPFRLARPGRHLVANALAAIAVGHLFGVDPKLAAAGLAAASFSGGRLDYRRAAGGAMVIDDSYNANPSSVKASLQVLREMGGEKTVAVLGDMLELGPRAAELHREVGRYAAGLALGHLITVGELSRETAAAASAAGLPAAACSGHDDALARLRALAPGEGWYILVKGSRGMKMEQIVQGLLKPARKE